MLVIIHAEHDRDPVMLAPNLPRAGDRLLLAGPPGAFDPAGIPPQTGATGASTMRLAELDASRTAFGLLADAARLLRDILAADAQEITYRRAGAAEDLPDTTAPVSWTLDETGRVISFRLTASVASSPLLARLAAELMDRDMKDDKRFAFLASAFSGY